MDQREIFIRKKAPRLSEFSLNATRALSATPSRRPLPLAAATRLHPAVTAVAPTVTPAVTPAVTPEITDRYGANLANRFIDLLPFSTDLFPKAYRHLLAMAETVGGKPPNFATGSHVLRGRGAQGTGGGRRAGTWWRSRRAGMMLCSREEESTQVLTSSELLRRPMMRSDDGVK